MKKFQQLGRLLSKAELKRITGGDEDVEGLEDDGIVPKTRCGCSTVSGPFLCNCGYEQNCVTRRCGAGAGWACAGC